MYMINTVKELWHHTIAQNREEMRRAFTPDAKILWHCTNEAFTLEEYIRANCEYPGSWLGEIERITSGDDGTVICAGHVWAKDGSISCHSVGFYHFTGDKVSALHEYWGDDSPPPQWRQDLKLGSPIN